MKDRFGTFTVLISKINRYIKRIKSVEMSEYNLKSIHVSIIYYLYKAGAMTAKELSDICDEDKAAISRAIDYLENNEYIECKATALKRYKSPLLLTEKGKAVAEVITLKIDTILNEASMGLTDSDRSVMYRSLEAISDNLQKIIDNYGD